MSTENLERTEKTVAQSSNRSSEYSNNTNRSENSTEQTPQREYRRPNNNNNRRRFQTRRKVCRFCKNTVIMNYREPDNLKRFVTERGKVLPRRITGTCAKHQRQLALTIKRSRVLALLPFVAK